MDDPLELKGRVAVITGAASGIGAGLARRFAREGMRLVLADVEAAPLEAKRSELVAGGAEAVARVTDVSQRDEVEALRELALDSFGEVFVIANNAGVSAGGPVWTIDEETWRWVIGVNLLGILHGIGVFVPDLVESDEGYVLNTASMQGLTVPAGAAPYTTTKFAAVAVSETLYHDLAAAGSSVGVSVLCPGPIATNIYASDRNRPGGAGVPVAPIPERPDVLAQGWTPDQLAAEVLVAMSERRFYVTTHPEYDSDIENRFEGIRGRSAPALLQPLATRTFSSSAPWTPEGEPLVLE
jgi:NAD(P)-dependent dehydrogenase (short-subunit alcohol dehydrogenase family)